jgi:hypothetical protein
MKSAWQRCGDDTATTLADSTLDTSKRSEPHMVLAGKLCIPQKGTAGRIATL